MTVPADRLAMTREGRIAWLRGHRRGLMTVPPDVARELADKRLSKTCPDCGRAEAASWYCSGCYLPMDHTDWHRETRAASPTDASQVGGGPEVPETVSVGASASEQLAAGL